MDYPDNSVLISEHDGRPRNEFRSYCSVPLNTSRMDQSNAASGFNWGKTPEKQIHNSAEDDETNPQESQPPGLLAPLLPLCGTLGDVLFLFSFAYDALPNHIPQYCAA